jgi:TRAP-type C4-dicarboxylate transport system permease small subunit
LIDVHAVRAMARAAHRFVLLAIGNFIGMAGLFRRAMDYLYLVCVIVGCTALVLISAVIPWAVFTRYVLNSAASWPEPMAVLLTIVLTFIGAAAGYRLNLHMNVSYFADQLPAKYRRLLDLIVQLLMALIAIFMIVWGERLVEVTWYNTIADFPFLSVGVTYLPIPIGGVCLLLFIVERVFLGAPSDPLSTSHETAPFE